MRGFLLGVTVGVILVVISGFTYIRLGFVDPRANIPIGMIEQSIAMPALDASVDRHAPEVKNPLEASDANLTAGMKIYQADCASCHGDVGHLHAALADALYPRAPQFSEDAPDMPEYQNFYIVKNGVRLSGMPAWNQSLNDEQMWQVTTFLSHMDNLPTEVLEPWKAATAGSTTTNPVPSPSMSPHMKMPPK